MTPVASPGRALGRDARDRIHDADAFDRRRASPHVSRRPRVASSSRLSCGTRSGVAPNDAADSSRVCRSGRSSLLHSSPHGIAPRARTSNDGPRRPADRADDGGRVRDDPDRSRRRAAAVARPAPPLFLRAPPLARRLRTLRNLIVRRVLVAEHRGFCAGVERAVETVVRSLDSYGAPIYVRKHIVHNEHVVADLEARGQSSSTPSSMSRKAPGSCLPPTGSRPPFIAPRPRAGLITIDATCPLVLEGARRGSPLRRRGLSDRARRPCRTRRGGRHRRGRRRRRSSSSRRSRTRETIDLSGDDLLAYVTQTTLSVDDTAEIIATLRARFPRIVGPRSEDICYATTNRQNAVKQLAARSTPSSSSARARARTRCGSSRRRSQRECRLGLSKTPCSSMPTHLERFGDDRRDRRRIDA